MYMRMACVWYGMGLRIGWKIDTHPHTHTLTCTTDSSRSPISYLARVLKADAGWNLYVLFMCYIYELFVR